MRNSNFLASNSHVNQSLAQYVWERYVPIHPKTINYKGCLVKLYPLKELCRAFNTAGISKSPQQIIQWETQGIIPTTPFIIENKRYYFESHIRTLVDIALENRIHRYTRINKTRFSEDAHELLNKVLYVELEKINQFVQNSKHV